MKNKKLLLLVLSCALFILIYFVNQLSFLRILTEPGGSEYSDFNNRFQAYLIADTNEYTELANKLNEELDSCVIYVDNYAKTAMYSDTCSEDTSFASESLRSNTRENTKYFDSIYEYIYNIREIKPMSSLVENEYVRYNEILVDPSVDLSLYLPNELNYALEENIYSHYSNEYTEGLIVQQRNLIVIMIITLLLAFIAGYVRLKRREIAIYELLGVNDKQILKSLIFEYWKMATVCYIASQMLYSVIVSLNGKLYYLAMYFEYCSFKNAIITYAFLMFLLLPIIIIIYVLTIINPIEKRLQ